MSRALVPFCVHEALRPFYVAVEQRREAKWPPEASWPHDVVEEPSWIPKEAWLDLLFPIFKK